MTTQEALLEIAEAFGTPYKERTVLQQYHTKFGICWYNIRFIDDDFESDIINDICYAENWGMYPYIYLLPTRTHFGFKEENDDIRSLFCCLLAQLTDEELKELTK